MDFLRLLHFTLLLVALLHQFYVLVVLREHRGERLDRHHVVRDRLPFEALALVYGLEHSISQSIIINIMQLSLFM